MSVLKVCDIFFMERNMENAIILFCINHILVSFCRLGVHYHKHYDSTSMSLLTR